MTDTRDAPLMRGDRVRLDTSDMDVSGVVVSATPTSVCAVLDGEREAITLPAYLVRREHGR